MCWCKAEWVVFGALANAHDTIDKSVMCDNRGCRIVARCEHCVSAGPVFAWISHCSRAGTVYPALHELWSL